jgi:translation elongation factor EF-Tu-like GTPase
MIRIDLMKDRAVVIQAVSNEIVDLLDVNQVKGPEAAVVLAMVLAAHVEDVASIPQMVRDLEELTASMVMFRNGRTGH